jgi:hypothetical protein
MLIIESDFKAIWKEVLAMSNKIPKIPIWFKI